MFFLCTNFTKSNNSNIFAEMMNSITLIIPDNIPVTSGDNKMFIIFDKNILTNVEIIL